MRKVKGNSKHASTRPCKSVNRVMSLTRGFPQWASGEGIQSKRSVLLLPNSCIVSLISHSFFLRMVTLSAAVLFGFREPPKQFQRSPRWLAVPLWLFFFICTQSSQSFILHVFHWQREVTTYMHVPTLMAMAGDFGIKATSHRNILENWSCITSQSGGSSLGFSVRNLLFSMFT